MLLVFPYVSAFVSFLKKNWLIKREKISLPGRPPTNEKENKRKKGEKNKGKILNFCHIDPNVHN